LPYRLPWTSPRSASRSARLTEIFRDNLTFTRRVTSDDWQRRGWRNFFYLPLIPLRDQFWTPGAGSAMKNPAESAV
jgi:hypothetical protein